MPSEECCVCLTFSENSSLLTENHNENTILFHLNNIVPEVEWNNNSAICPACLENLSIVTAFKELCINSNTSRVMTLGLDQNQKQYHVEENATEKIEIRICNDFDDENECYSKKPLNRRKHRCFKCGRSFMKETSLKLHRKVCDGIGRHSKHHFQERLANNTCPKCTRCYTTRKILNDHMKSCSGIKEERSTDYNSGLTKIRCAHCKAYFFKKEKYEIHLKESHAFVEENPKIKRESAETRSEIDTRKNEKFHYEFSCNICSEKFKWPLQVFRHSRKKHKIDKSEVKPYSCNFCNQHFSNRAKVLRHIGNHTGKLEQICTYCGKGFKNKDYLKSHERIHNSKRNFSCKKCHKSFKTHSNLHIHEVVVHADPSSWKYSCEFCGKRFPMKSRFDDHLRRHIGERNYQCGFCDLAFFSNHELKRHRDRCRRGISTRKKRGGKSETDEEIAKERSDESEEEVVKLSKFVENDWMDVVFKIEEGEHVIEVIQIAEDESANS